MQRKLNMKKVFLFLFTIVLFIFILTRFSKSLKIALKGSETINITVGSSYTDEGAIAYYGKKDVSNTIQSSGTNIDTSKVGSYTITYTAKHKKKTATKTRTINIVDTEKPTIKLNGSEEINIAQDSTYQELGCTALDNCDRKHHYKNHNK